MGKDPQKIFKCAVQKFSDIAKIVFGKLNLDIQKIRFLSASMYILWNFLLYLAFLFLFILFSWGNTGLDLGEWPLRSFLALFLVHLLFCRRYFWGPAIQKKIMFVSVQVILVVIVIPSFLTSLSIYNARRLPINDVYDVSRYVYDFDSAFFNDRLGYFSGSVAMRYGRHSRIGPWLLFRRENESVRFINENKFLTSFKYKIPIVGYYVRLADPYSFIDPSETMGKKSVVIAAREMTKDGSLLTVYHYNFEDKIKNKLGSVKLKKEELATPATMQKIMSGVFQINLNYSRRQDAWIGDYYMFVIPETNEFVYVERSQITNSDSDSVSLTYADMQKKLLYFLVSNQETTRIVNYNYRDRKTIVGESGEDRYKLTFTLSAKVFIDQELKTSNDFRIGSFEHIDTFSQDEYAIFASILSKKETKLYLFSRKCHDDGAPLNVLSAPNLDTVCLMASVTMPGTSYDFAPSKLVYLENWREENLWYKRGLILENREKKVLCGKGSSYYIFMDNMILEVEELPNGFKRDGFDYVPIYFELSDVENKDAENNLSSVTYEISDCDDPDWNYFGIYNYLEDGKVELDAFYPNWDQCSSELCGVPAATIDVVDQSGEEIPTAFVDESEAHADVLFPQSDYEYIATGVRDDVYQFLGTGRDKFSMINIPIKEGMVHRYKFDWEKQESGEPGWISIAVDVENDGVAEATITAGEIFTGEDFLKQCGQPCADMGEHYEYDKSS